MKKIALMLVMFSLLALPALAEEQEQEECTGSMVWSEETESCIATGNSSWIVVNPRVAMSREYDGKIIALGNQWGTAQIELSADPYFIDTELIGDSYAVYHEIAIPEGYSGYARIVITMNYTTVYGYPIFIE